MGLCSEINFYANVIETIALEICGNKGGRISGVGCIEMEWDHAVERRGLVEKKTSPLHFLFN